MGGEPQPDLAMLCDWATGRLDPRSAARVAAAVEAGDAAVQARVRWLRGFLAVAQQLPLHQPPPIVRQRLQQHFRLWSAARAVLEPQPVRIQTRLLFDSRQDLALAGVRSTDPDDGSIHLAFVSDVADVVLDVRRSSGGRVRLDGQVLLADPEGAGVFEATVRGEGFETSAIDGDDLGRFSLADVPATVTELDLFNGELRIVAALSLHEEP
jgi:hypothetical protein